MVLFGPKLEPFDPNLPLIVWFWFVSVDLGPPLCLSDLQVRFRVSFFVHSLCLLASLRKISIACAGSMSDDLSACVFFCSAILVSGKSHDGNLAPCNVVPF